MNRRHFLASVSATAIMPMRTFAAQDALRVEKNEALGPTLSHTVTPATVCID